MFSTEAAPAEASSFRDPSGHVFSLNGRLYRRINRSYGPHYDHLMASGLYDALVERGLLVAHREVPVDLAGGEGAYRVIEPEMIPFISYPFEWAFSELKEAALATLAVHRLAITRGMTLKDASAYNIQFRGCRPVLIDTLSFEIWNEGSPWIAYRQFCQHFLGPLALMARAELRLGQLSRLFIDGPPLDLVSRLLPWSSRLSPSLLMHVHAHARAQVRHGRETLGGDRPSTFRRTSMLGLVDHLKSAIEKLTCRASRGPWIDYYDHTNYSGDAMAAKERLVTSFLDRERPALVWDLGANTGAFSRIAASRGAYTIAFDSDAASVDRHYLDCRSRSERSTLPLVMDLANPTGGMGWGHAERRSLDDRGPADVVLALGLIHHLRIANQVPFAAAADFFARLAPVLIVELPSPDDSQVRAMLARAPAFVEDYSPQSFEAAFAQRFDFVTVSPIPGSERCLYLMIKKHGRP